MQLLTTVVLISRLINAHSHLLALRISKYLGMNKEVVIMHWACAKITASPSTPDAHLLEILLDKAAAVATHADNCGFKFLNIKDVLEETEIKNRDELLKARFKMAMVLFFVYPLI